MEKLDGKSMDLVQTNIEALKKLFPEVVTEGKIDFEKLKLVLGEEIEKRNERYEFTWHGKTQAMKLAQTPSTGTLRPDKQSSKNWDTTENLYIEGDNLEVLKLLQKSYFGKIKMIYIDPPYNTGKDFVYKDDFRDNIKNYKEMTQQTTKANTETNGRYHTDWLNMMYPRLKLARNLLREDGVIFISIDDHEMANLKKICDEIFGQENFIGNFIWSAGRKNDSKYISNSHEYVLCYFRNMAFVREAGLVWREKKEGLKEIYDVVQEFIKESNNDYKLASKLLKEWYNSLSDNHPSKQHKHYNCIDERGVYFPSDLSKPEANGARYEILHPVTKKPVKQPAGGWRYMNKEKMLDLINDNRIHFGDDETTIPCYKRYLFESEYQVPYSVFYQDNRSASKRLKDLFEKKVFDFPKDENIVKKLISAVSYVQEDSGSSINDIILDFFSGSATTAHAVMQLNAEDGGNRKFIMIQLPEPTDENSEAYKAGYKNICEIGKERIRRAGEKIVQETGKNDLDIGFKVFTLDSSNIKTWDPDFENLKQDLFDYKDNMKEDRTKEDLLYEILLKIGLPLTTPIEEIDYNGKTIYNVGFGAVLLCLENDIDLDIVHEMMKHKSEHLSPKVIFKESGFMNDSVKINAIQTLKKNGINDVRSV
ncbi:type III restriction-modification system, DNA methylase [Anoxybacillus flavithermus TNO-09.006]|uniref:site-specific DNA-methyltransferase n=1 Tax=Anoxybacillus flavithermus TaxID=33934 RepID=UPI0002A7356B|nr:site-specific DNA-methyltransferase [Anoxybacillus flavithermus]ELK21589.1 type III restriction-modification system, DNA methylase [Anoxybacillus flavithermus TNO-09.006]